MYCRKCGTNLPEDSQFCAKCGTKVEDPNSEAKAAESDERPPVAGSGEPARSASSVEEESLPLMFSHGDSEPYPRRTIESSPKPSGQASLPAAAPEDPKPSAPTQGGGVELPPSLLPSPDGIRSATQQQIEADEEQRKREKARKKSKKRWHPLEGYQPLKERFRFGGCSLLFFLVIVVPIATVGTFGWIQYNTFVDQKGFDSVIQKGANVIEASANDTLYWGASALYEAEETDAEVALIGGTWWLNGTFREKVYFRGFRLVLEEGARFEKGLDVQAAIFHAGKAEIEGDLTGNIAIQR